MLPSDMAFNGERPFARSRAKIEPLEPRSIYEATILPDREWVRRLAGEIGSFFDDELRRYRHVVKDEIEIIDEKEWWRRKTSDDMRRYPWWHLGRGVLPFIEAEIRRREQL